MRDFQVVEGDNGGDSHVGLIKGRMGVEIGRPDSRNILSLDPVAMQGQRRGSALVSRWIALPDLEHFVGFHVVAFLDSGFRVVVFRHNSFDRNCHNHLFDRDPKNDRNHPVDHHTETSHIPALHTFLYVLDYNRDIERNVADTFGLHKRG